MKKNTKLFKPMELKLRLDKSQEKILKGVVGGSEEK